jgi:hypothetical protein
MATPTEVLIEVTRVFEKLHIPYFVVGSFASSARGVRRATIDGDIVADIPRADVTRLVAELSSRDFYIDDRAVRRAIESERSFNAIHRESIFKIDIYVSRDEFSKMEMQRKLPEKVLPNSDTIIYIATAEDTAVAKLSWFRKGREVSDRQWSDVLGILKVQKGNLDYEYMKEWSQRLGVRDLLDRALEEA